MDELIQTLEERLKALLQKHSLLQKNQEVLLSEKKQLVETHQGAVSQVERMIDRLKSLEEKA